MDTIRRCCAGLCCLLFCSFKLVASPPEDCRLLTNGMVGWWRGENSAADSSGNGNYALLLGETTFINAVAGRGFLFPGTDIPAGVKVPASASVNVGTNDGFTVEAWINPYSLNRRGPIFEWNNSHTNDVVTWGVHFMIFEPQEFGLGAGNLIANVGEANGFDHLIFAPGGTLTTGVFQHVALTFNRADGTTRIYRNGEKVAEAVFGSFTPHTSYDLFIGRRPAGDQSTPYSFHGVIDEPAIFNRALHGDEIADIYHAGSRGHCVNTNIQLTVRLSHVQVCWTSYAGRTYQVEYRSEMANGAWHALGSPITGTGGELCVEDPVSQGIPHRAYRVREL